MRSRWGWLHIAPQPIARDASATAGDAFDRHTANALRMTHVIDGNAVARTITESLEPALSTLAAAGVTPGLATVLMSDDPGDGTAISLKQEACERVGLESVGYQVDPEEPAAELYATLRRATANPAVHGVFLQHPLPSHVDPLEAGLQIEPVADIDAAHPETVGRLVAGNPRYVPPTTHAIQRLLEVADVSLEVADVSLEGTDVTIVGRSAIVGKPLANLLLQDAAGGNATVTVCHSRTDRLAEKTRQADILVAATGVPELIDGSMIKTGATVIDVGGTRLEDGTLVGDLEFESAREQADVITPVPGGVGPVTVAMVLSNTVRAAASQEAITLGVELPDLTQ